MKNQFAVKYSKSIAGLYRIIDKAINDLEEFLLCDELTEIQLKKWEMLYGSKETIVSIAIKLVSTLSQIIPMEQKVMTAIDNSKDKKIQDISKEDVEIIKRYLQKVKETKEEIDEDKIGSNTD